MNCNICHSAMTELAIKKVLGKYDVRYYQCSFCHFIQTEEPYWLNEAYENAITKLDIGLVYRNERLVPIVSTIINLFYKNKSPYLDYGGGYGLFVRMMRDRGFDFYRQDIYCENLFAKHFDITDLNSTTKFGLITAFEVIEHVINPLEEVNNMLDYGTDILLTTELQPPTRTELNNWWYFTPETGQHISLFSKRSLELIAEKFQLNLYSKSNIHLLSANKLSSATYKLSMNSKFRFIQEKINKRVSFLNEDFEKVRSLINKKRN